ncbi:MAG: NETI motif-containing protein [Sporolactobacillus sp.]
MKKGKKRISQETRNASRKTFLVAENETIAACIERMAKEGYAPIKRIEKPIFREGPTGPVLAGRQCIFEGRLKDEQ